MKPTHSSDLIFLISTLLMAALVVTLTMDALRSAEPILLISTLLIGGLADDVSEAG